MISNLFNGFVDGIMPVGIALGISLILGAPMWLAGLILFSFAYIDDDLFR